MSSDLFKLSLTLLLVITFASCGKKHNTSKTSIKIFDSAAVTGVPQVGGVLVLGHRLDDFQAFHVGILNGQGELQLELEKGPWEFYAIGWDGTTSPHANKHLGGENRCGYLGIIEIDQPDQNIQINLNKGNCTLPLPGGEEINDSGFYDTADTTMFVDLAVKSCLTLPLTPSGTSCDLAAAAGDEGLTMSYKIIVPGGFEENKNFKFGLPGLESACVDIINQDSSGESSGIRIPVGTANDSLFEPILMAYPETGCSGAPIFYEFRDGIFGGITNENKMTTLEGGIFPDRALVFIEHNPQTVNENVGFNIFGNGSDGAATNLVAADFTASKVTDINLGDKRMVDVASSTGFSVGDEVILYVNDQYGGTGCGTGSFTPGLFNFHHIKKITGNTLEFFREATEIHTESGPVNLYYDAAIQGTIQAASAIGSGDWCSIQIARVPNFSTLTASAAISYSATAYSDTGGSGGLTVMRVRDEISTPTSAINLSIDATGGGQPAFHTADYSVCHANNWPCLGLSPGGDNPGGGTVLVIAESINLSMGDMIVTSSGSGGATVGAKGGQVFVQTNNLDVPVGRTLTLDVQGLTGTAGGNGGDAELEYCSGLSNALGTLNLISTGGSPGGTLGFTNINPNECN